MPLFAEYSLDDTNGDTSFNSFNIDRAPSYLFSVLKDIQSLNKITRIHIVPWSPVRLKAVCRCFEGVLSTL